MLYICIQDGTAIYYLLYKCWLLMYTYPKPAKTPILTADMALSSIHVGKYI